MSAVCGLNAKKIQISLTSNGGIFADGVVETVITFDQGAKWQTLRRPQNSQCDTETSTNRPTRVRNTQTHMFS